MMDNGDSKDQAKGDKPSYEDKYQQTIEELQAVVKFDRICKQLVSERFRGLHPEVPFDPDGSNMEGHSGASTEHIDHLGLSTKEKNTESANKSIKSVWEPYQQSCSTEVSSHHTRKPAVQFARDICIETKSDSNVCSTTCTAKIEESADAQIMSQSPQSYFRDHEHNFHNFHAYAHHKDRLEDERPRVRMGTGMLGGSFRNVITKRGQGHDLSLFQRRNLANQGHEEMGPCDSTMKTDHYIANSQNSSQHESQTESKGSRNYQSHSVQRGSKGQGHIHRSRLKLPDWLVRYVKAHSQRDKVHIHKHLTQFHNYHKGSTSKDPTCEVKQRIKKKRLCHHHHHHCDDSKQRDNDEQWIKKKRLCHHHHHSSKQRDNGEPRRSSSLHTFQGSPSRLADVSINDDKTMENEVISKEQGILTQNTEGSKPQHRPTASSDCPLTKEGTSKESSKKHHTHKKIKQFLITENFIVVKFPFMGKFLQPKKHHRKATKLHLESAILNDMSTSSSDESMYNVGAK